MLQVVTSLTDSAWIDCFGALLDVLHDSVLVNQESGAHGQTLGRVENTILLADRSLEVAEQRECHAEVFGKTLVAGRGIHADAQNLSIVGVEFCDISLICA